MTQLTAQGFERTRLDERFAQLQESMRGIFGQDINVDPDSLDGQALGIFAEAISNLDQLAEDVYHSQNPQTAMGVALQRLVQLNSIKHKGGSYSNVVLRCGGSQGTFIKAGSLVKHNATGASFQTLVDATIDGTGLVDVAAQAVSMGAVIAAAGTLTKIDSPIYGWQTVTNIAAAITGTDEETIEQLRIRRKQSTSTAGTANTDAIYGALLNLAGVTAARVWENDTDVVDGNGMPSRSLYCVVRGGVDADILKTIWNKKGQGVRTLGSTSGVVNDSQGNPHTLHYSQAPQFSIYIIVNLHRYAGWPTDGDVRIKNAIIAWANQTYNIGDEVVYSRLYDPINSVPGHSINSLYIGTAPAPTGVADITVPFDNIASFDVAHIVVNLL